jgi:hypothetical protein
VTASEVEWEGSGTCKQARRFRGRAAPRLNPIKENRKCFALGWFYLMVEDGMRGGWRVVCSETVGVPCHMQSI